MRGHLLVIGLALLALPLSGCVEDGATEPASETFPATVGPSGERSLPENMSVSNLMRPSADPTIMIDGTICGPTAHCVEVPFTVATNASMEALLTWSLDVNDLDLHLIRPDGSVSSAAFLLPGTAEYMAVDVDAGEHKLVVAGFLVTQETFTLDVYFA